MMLPIQPAEASKPAEPRVALTRSSQLCEEVNNVWRHVAPTGISKEDLEQAVYSASKDSGYNYCDSIT
jgi:hypothetical protein